MRRTAIGIVLLPLLVVAGLLAAQSRPLEVYFVDVEGGAATLIVTPAGESVLIDSGNPGERDAGRIARAAGQAGLQRIDHVLTTHWHADHVGGVDRLAELMPIGRFYDRGLPRDPLPKDIRPDLMEAYHRRTEGRSVHLKPGDRIDLRQPASGPALSLRVLASGGAVAGERADAPHIRQCGTGYDARPLDESDNALSLALQLTFGDFELFAGGDLTWNVEHKLICPPPQVGPVDVFLVNHHGLDSSNHPGLVAALRPAVAIFNNGARKGAQPRTFTTVQAVPGLEAIFQLHRNLQEGGHNTAAAHIANEPEECEGTFIKLTVAPDAQRYEVSVPSQGTKREFETRTQEAGRRR